MQTVRRLVPNFIIEKYKADELRGTCYGAAIFVDLAGFSKMVDTLSSHGQPGAETLAELMRLVFEPLVNAVYEQGGFVIGYAGDAFNAFFPNDQIPGLETRRCLSALVTMQEHVRSHPKYKTRFGDFPISIKAGMGYGETRWQMFKSKTGKHLTYWMRGDSINRAIFAEERAAPGEIFADPLAFERINDIAETQKIASAFRIEKTLVSLPEPKAVNEPVPDLAPMNLFFAEDLLLQPFVGEFRHVINLFIDIPINISDEELMKPFMETVYSLQEEYGGFFLRPELGDKGFNLLMLWGAPIAREHDVERALDFVTELARRAKLNLRAGITYRTAYAGFMGTSLREDYTAYGWGITLAARLMTYANEGEFWLDEEIARRAEKNFNVKYLGNYAIKGFAKKQRTYQLLGKKTETQTFYDGELIGREDEIITLVSFMDTARKGKSAGLMLITGEAGIGKSRLVHTFQASDYFKNFPAQWIRFQTEKLVRTAFNPFYAWLKRRFKVIDSESNANNWNTFMHNLDELAAATPHPELASELNRTGSVLAALIGLTHPDSLYETLDAKARYENTLIALSALLRAESLQQPLVLFLEDAHWLDEDSAAFFEYFMRLLRADDEKEYPIAIIATQRPEKESPLSDESTTHHLVLGKLSHISIHALAKDILGRSISTQLGNLLNKRAEGNPFFAEQILHYLSEERLLTLNADGEYSAEEKAINSIPLDVHAVLIARLDRLTQKVRETVQTASVLGREFVVEILVEMLRSQLENLPGYVYAAEQAKIWANLNEIEYIFSHALLRDAAYSMQLEVRQQRLHKLAFDAIREVYSEDLKLYYGDLAYHAERGELKEEALHYLTLAGDLAKNAYQNRQAIDFFTRALAMLPNNDHQSEFDLRLKRVECYYNLSDSTAQEKDLEQMELHAQELDDNTLLAHTFVRQAYRLSTSRDFKNSAKYAEKARELAEKARDDEILMLVYVVLPDALSHIGELAKARQYAEEGVAYARKIKDLRGEAHALTALGLILLDLEDSTTAHRQHEKALIAAREIKDRNLEAKILNNLSISVGISQGDYHVAREYITQALSVFQEQGNQAGKGIALANLGWLSSILGDYRAAMSYYERSLGITRALGHHLEEMYTYVNLSASAIGQELASDALSWAQKAIGFSATVEDHIAQAWTYFYLGHALLLNKNPKDAAHAFDRCIELRNEGSAPGLLIEARAGLTQAYLETNDQDKAQEEAEYIFSHMEKDKRFEGAEEPLRVYYTLYSAMRKKRDPRVHIVLENANELLDEQVSKLQSIKAQRIFIENVPWRRAIKYATEN